MATPTLDTPPEATAAPRETASRGRLAGLGGTLIIVGAGIIYATIGPFGRTTGLIKVPGVLVGLAALYLAVRSLGRAVWGGGFDAGFWLSVVWLVLLLAAAIAADQLPLSNYDEPAKTLSELGYETPNLLSAHPLGTNGQALDLLGQAIYAARVSILISFCAVTISVLFGGAIGLLAGYFRGKLDLVIGTLTDASLSVPGLVLLIALASVLGVPGSVGEAIVKEGGALAVVSIPTMIRLTRPHAISIAQREFVAASRTLGTKHRRILFYDVLPNVIPPVAAFAFVMLAILIVVEGSLSFLGLGLQQPIPTWGNMIAEADLQVLSQHPTVALVPGGFMLLTVLSLNRIGERARRFWDVAEEKI